MPKASELLALFQHFKRGYAAALHPVEQSYQLTRNELDVLLFLSNNPGFATARDMVEMRGLTKSHVCKSVDALTRRSFLAARRDPQDRRVLRLSLLPASTLAVSAAQEAQRAFFQRVFQGVTEEERGVMDRLTRHLLAQLREGMPL